MSVPPAQLPQPQTPAAKQGDAEGKAVVMPRRIPDENIGPWKIVYDQTQPIDKETTTILYGESGVGKTTLARSWPRPFFIFFRGGGEHRPLPLIGSKCPYVEILTTNHLDQLLAVLAKDGLPKHGDGQKCETVVVDQLPSFYNLYATHIMHTVLRGRENEHTFARNDFRQARHHTHQLFFDLNKIPGIHRLYLSIANTYEDKDTKEKDCMPNLPGVLSDEVPAFSDFTLHLHTKRVMQSIPITPQTPRGGSILKEIRCVAAQSYSHGAVNIFAKDSSGRLPPFIDIPDPDFPLFDEIVKYLRK